MRFVVRKMRFNLSSLKKLTAKRRFFVYLLAIGPAIVFFSCLPNFHPENYVDDHYRIPGDKWVHLFGYFLAGGLGTVILIPDWKLVLLSLCLLFVFSFAIEWVQEFIPGRAFSWLDVVFNAAGIFLASVVSYFAYRWANRKLPAGRSKTY